MQTPDYAVAKSVGEGYVVDKIRCLPLSVVQPSYESWRAFSGYIAKWDMDTFSKWKDSPHLNGGDYLKGYIVRLSHLREQRNKD